MKTKIILSDLFKLLRRYKISICLVGILILSLLLRLIWTNAIPVSLNLDELYYLIHAKSFFFTGKDLYQTIPLWKIFIFQYPPQGMPQSELPFLLHTLLSGFPSSFLIQALPNIIMSIGSVFLMYRISTIIFNKRIGLVSAFLMAINPWSVFIGRTSYEMVGAVFFILAGYFVILRTKGVKVLFSIPLFLFVFYSYIGTKVLIVPLLIIFFMSNYFLFRRKKQFIWYGLVVLFFILFSLFYYYQISKEGLSRLSEITTPSHPLIISQVNDIRKNTITTPLSSLLTNKYTVFGSAITRLLLQVFSPVYLFFEGDYVSALGNQGLFYAIDIVFLFIGCMQLWKKNIRLFFIIIALCLIATIPQIIHDATGLGSNFSAHIVLLIPLFLFIISYGINELFNLFLKRKLFVGIGVVIILYVIQFSGFINSYFFQFPFHNGLFNLTTHTMTQYLARSKNKIAVYGLDPKLLFSHYLYTENKFTKETSKSIISSYKNKDYKLSSINFYSCDVFPNSLLKNITTIIDPECGKKYSNPSINIPRPSDAGAAMVIYNDITCSSYQLPGYPSGLTLRKIEMKNLSNQEFCETFISQY